jgi:hypothetical protein
MLVGWALADHRHLQHWLGTVYAGRQVHFFLDFHARLIIISGNSYWRLPMGFSKLHSSLVNSSLWTQPDSTRILFITLLALSDRSGMVYGSREGISRIANVAPDDIDEAWSSLMSPDPDSSDRLRNPENEGRRIEEVPGGFRLLNYPYYRGLRNEDDRREQNREAQERFRKKAAISQRQPRSATVSPDNPPSSHAEADADAEALTPPTPSKGASVSKPRKLRKPFVKPTPAEVDAYIAEKYPAAVGHVTGDEFVSYYESVGWLVGHSRKPMTNWHAAVYTWYRNWAEKQEGK